jgi:hypothetical protein
MHSFNWILSVFRMRLSTDPRDKIYGLLWLAPEELNGIFHLDYSTPVEDVFETFTIEYAQNYRSLGLLGALGGKRQLPDLTSFCPDWTVVPGDKTRNDEATMIQVSNRLVVQPLYLDFSGSAEANWRKIGRATVAVNGFIFDVIRDVSLECFRLSWEARRQRAEGLPTLAGQPDILSLLSALCGDLSWSQETTRYDLIEDNDKASEDRLKKWWEWTLSGGSSGPVRDGDINSVEHAVLTISAGRNFVVTEKGYIGYADQRCRPGHLVSILGGGQTPFVLASISSQYQVIGDAYIHGIMRGHAFNLAGRQTGEFDELILV